MADASCPERALRQEEEQQPTRKGGVNRVVKTFDNFPLKNTASIGFQVDDKSDAKKHKAAAKRVTHTALKKEVAPAKPTEVVRAGNRNAPAPLMTSYAANPVEAATQEGLFRRRSSEIHQMAQDELHRRVRSLLAQKLQNRMKELRDQELRVTRQGDIGNGGAEDRKACLEGSGAGVSPPGAVLSFPQDHRGDYHFTDTTGSTDALRAASTGCTEAGAGGFKVSSLESTGRRKAASPGKSSSDPPPRRKWSVKKTTVPVEEMETIDVHPYSAVDLVRVNQLVGIPDHNRGLFAWLGKKRFTTRSGHLTVGMTDDAGGRARGAAAAFALWKYQQERTSDQDGKGQKKYGLIAGTGRKAVHALRVPLLSSQPGAARPPRMVLKPVDTDGQTFFQWVEDDSDLHSADESVLGPDGDRFDGTLSPNTLRKILSFDGHGRPLTDEEKREAERRLREYRQRQQQLKNGKGALIDSKESGLGSLIAASGHLDANGDDWLGGKDGDHGHASHPLVRDYSDQAQVVTEEDGPSGLHLSVHSPVSTSSALDVDGSTYHRAPSFLDRTITSAEAAVRRRHKKVRICSADKSSTRRSSRKTDETPFHDGSVSALHSAATPMETSATHHALFAGRDSTEESRNESFIVSAEVETTSDGGTSSRTATKAEKKRERRAEDQLHYSGDSNGSQHSGSFSHHCAPGENAHYSPTETDYALPEVIGETEDGAANSAAPGTRRELQQLKDEEDALKLEEFATLFPESEHHVQLRKEARGILADFEELLNDDDRAAEFPLPNFLNMAGGSNEGSMTGEDGQRAEGNQFGRPYRRKARNQLEGEGEKDEEADAPVHGFLVEEVALREKFRLEAEEEYGDLVQQRNEILALVQHQRQVLTDFLEDAHFLSVGKAGGLTAEQYALMLTEDVNAYAHANRLKWGLLVQENVEEAVGHVSDGFLDKFGKNRDLTREVGCQVCDADLGYVDEGVRSTAVEMEDLLMHERALYAALRLATVAVANIMGFHTSLEMEATCKECFYIFDRPRTLWPCGHTFCQQCLAGMYNKHGELICAECGSVCEVGYTPNLSLELIANYQAVQDDFAESGGGRGATSPKRSKAVRDGAIRSTAGTSKGAHTIEGVLRQLFNEFLSTQSNWYAGESGTA